MKWILASLALVAVVQDTFAYNSSLRVTWGRGEEEDYGDKYYKYIPRNTKEAEESGWDVVTPPSNTFIDSDMYCYSDRQICGYYDLDTGFIIGMHTAIPKEYITNSIYDFVEQGYSDWTADVNGVSTDFWANELWFVSETYMEKSLEERTAAAEANITLQEEAVWVRGFYGEMVSIPTSISDIIDNGYLKQGCFNMMGTHYYYNMSETTICSATTLFPYVPLADDGEFIGFSVVTWITLSAQEGVRSWYEKPTGNAAKSIVPYGPDCLTEAVKNYGVITLHIYFKDKPWEISCS